MSSRNDSSLICSSVKRKTTFLQSAPDILRTFSKRVHLRLIYKVKLAKNRKVKVYCAFLQHLPIGAYLFIK